MSREERVYWFHGKLARDQAEAVLRADNNNSDAAEDGTSFATATPSDNGRFLVRESHSSDGDYVLSVLHQGEIYHYQIRRHGEDAFFSIDEQQPLHGLDTLIEHYCRASHGLVVRLGDCVRSSEQLPPETRSHGRTNLLHRATREGDVTVVSELLKCGYRNIDAKNHEGQTAVHLASRCGIGTNQQPIIEQLLANGANVNSRDSAGNTSLHYVCHSAAVPVIRMLIDAGANLQARNNATGCVPLHEAARHGHLGAVQALLGHGAPLMPRSDSGELPIDFARDAAHHDVASYLEHYRLPDASTYKYQWYHGTLDRAEATAILVDHARSSVQQHTGTAAHGNAEKCNDDGTPTDVQLNKYDGVVGTPPTISLSSGWFLVRFSAKTGDFVLTLLFEGQPKNFIIQKYMKYLYIDEGPYMPTLEHLIQHYQRFSDGLPVNLRYAVPPKPKPPLPLFSTIPRSPRHGKVHSIAKRAPTTPLLDQGNISMPSSDGLMNTVGLHSPASTSSLSHTSGAASPLITRPGGGDREPVSNRCAAGDSHNFNSLKLKSPKSPKSLIIDGVKSLKKSKKCKKIDTSETVAAITPDLSLSLRNLSFSSDLKPIGQPDQAMPLDLYNVPTNNAAVATSSVSVLDDDTSLPPTHSPPPPHNVEYFTESDYTFGRDKDSENIYFIDAPTKQMCYADGSGATDAAAAENQSNPPIAYTPFKVVPYFPDPMTAITPPQQSAIAAAASRPFDRLESSVSLTSTASERFFRQQHSTDDSSVGPTSPNYFISANALQKHTVLGNGEFGSVFAGTFRNAVPNEPAANADDRANANYADIPVAIKTLHDEHCTHNRAEFLREASVMLKLSHHCIVRLIGISKGPPLMMVQELVELGSMLTFITEHPEQISVHSELKVWAAQIASGMDYLESHHFVHRDLAARNILLASRRQAKISDFGLSRALATDRNYYQASQGGKWPIKWYAPESFNYGTFSHASDVWSFGVTLWEMFSYGQVPYGDLKGVDVIKLVEMGDRLPRTERCPEHVYVCMESCWNYNPSDRPTFGYLMRFFASDPDYQNVVDIGECV